MKTYSVQRENAAGEIEVATFHDLSEMLRFLVDDVSVFPLETSGGERVHAYVDRFGCRHGQTVERISAEAARYPYNLRPCERPSGFYVGWDPGGPDTTIFASAYRGFAAQEIVVDEIDAWPRTFVPKALGDKKP